MTAQPQPLEYWSSPKHNKDKCSPDMLIVIYLTVTESQTLRTDSTPQDLRLETRQVSQYSAGLVVPGSRIK